jgi:hypothetical protein
MPKKASPAAKKEGAVITNQTTPEELEAKINAVDEETPEETTVTRGPDVTPPEETNTEEEEVSVEEAPEEQEVAPVVEVAPEEPDWKSRYIGSTREAQVLAARNKKFAESVDKANSLEKPTDEEMRTEYGDNWEMMDDVQRKLAKETVLSSKRFAILNEVATETKKGEEWVEKAKVFVADPQVLVKYPQLEGKETEFVQFCSLPTRVGVDLDDLVRAFSFDIKEEVPKRKTLFESGGGGQAPAPKELTVDEIAFLRTHDSKKYKQLLASGKIKIEV